MSTLLELFKRDFHSSLNADTFQNCLKLLSEYTSVNEFQERLTVDLSNFPILIQDELKDKAVKWSKNIDIRTPQQALVDEMKLLLSNFNNSEPCLDSNLHDFAQVLTKNGFETIISALKIFSKIASKIYFRICWS